MSHPSALVCPRSLIVTPREVPDIVGRNRDRRSPSVHVVGRESPATETVEAAIEAAGYRVERVASVATVSRGRAALVVMVAPAIDVPIDVGVDRVRRAFGETPIVMVADEVPAVAVDAVAPVDEDDVERVVRDVLADEEFARPGRRLQQLAGLLVQTEPTPVDADGGVSESGPAMERICRRLVDAGIFETSWIAESRNAAIVPISAAGVPVSTLRTVEPGADVAWARAIREGDPVVGADRRVVAVPFDDRCLVCTSAEPITDPEVELLTYAVSAVTSGAEDARGESVDGPPDEGRPRYALLGEAVAHEVNNQLDLAMVHLDLVDERDDHIDHVETALDRIGSVVQEVNALVAPQLSVTEVPLGEVAEDVWSGVSTEAATLEIRDGGAEGSTDGGGEGESEAGPGGSPLVRADERLLRLLLANLFRNAVQHAGDDATVEVGPTPDGGFYVADDGPGFDDATEGQLFEWGWSGSERSGVGLALVALVADRHGWTVETDDTDGARFEFVP